MYGAGMLALVLLQSASPSPSAPTGLELPGWVVIVAALGVGSLVGSIAVTVVGYINGERQRSHEQRLREEDRRHEREMAEAEYGRRMDKQRRKELRGGLASVVDAVLDLERWLNFVQWEDVPAKRRPPASWLGQLVNS